MRRRRANGSLSQTSSGFIRVISGGIEGLHQRDKIPQSLNAQLRIRLISRRKRAGPPRGPKSVAPWTWMTSKDGCMLPDRTGTRRSTPKRRPNSG